MFKFEPLLHTGRQAWHRPKSKVKSQRKTHILASVFRYHARCGHARACPGLLLLILTLARSAAARAPVLEGYVVDQKNAPVARAMVRLIDPPGSEVAHTMTDERGHFRFFGFTAAGRTVEASLSGFETTRAPATPGKELKLVLSITPVHESIVVTATRTELPTDQLGASVSVIPASEISNGHALFVGDLLQTVASATVVRSGGVGSLTSLFSRGGESNYNKVLLDGIPLNEPGGSFDFSNLSTDRLERIEVVRGPQSALFGTDAMTSVVQLFTRRAESETTRPHFSLSFEGGKNDTWRGHAGLSGIWGRWDYGLEWSRFSTDNQVPNDFFHDTSLVGSFGVSLGERTTVRLILRGSLSLAGVPGQTAFGPPDRDGIFRRRDGYGAFSIHHQTATNWQQRLTYTVTKSRQVSRDLGTDPPFTPAFEGHVAQFTFYDFAFDFLNDTRRHHLDYQSDWRGGSLGRALGGHAFTFAFDWDRELGLLGDRFSGEQATHALRDNFGWTLQHQALWRRFSLVNSARVEKNGSFGTTVVPRSSLAYFLRPGGRQVGATKLKFNFGLGVKEPDFLQSYAQTPFFSGNPRLAPERARSFDFGVEQKAWEDRAKLEVNWFDNRFRDQIAFEVTNFQTFSGTYFNIGRAKAKGAEAILELAPHSGLRAIGSYTYLDSEIIQSGSPFDPSLRDGQSLLRRPRHSGSLRLLWDWRRSTASSSIVFVGGRVDSDFVGLVPPLTWNDGYSKWDLAWSFRASHRLTYFAAVENLLDQKYMPALGYPALKFTVRGGARIDF